MRFARFIPISILSAVLCVSLSQANQARSGDDPVAKAKADYGVQKEKFLQEVSKYYTEFVKFASSEIEDLNSAKISRGLDVRQRINLKESMTKDLKNFTENGLPPMNRSLRGAFETFAKKRNSAREKSSRNVKALAEIAGMSDLNAAKEILEDWDRFQEKWHQPIEALDPEKPWITLFNGKDLTGWNTKGGSGVTTITAENGVLTGRCNKAPAGYVDHLITDRSDFQDFRLQYELMLDGPRLVAPMMFRIDPSTAIYGGMRGYIFRIFGTGPGTPRAIGNSISFALSSRASTDFRFETAPAAIPTPSGKWLKVEILAKGDRFRATIDGREVLDTTDPGGTIRKGAIGFVFMSDIVANYRNVRIQELPVDQPAGAGRNRSRWVSKPYRVDRVQNKRWHERWSVFNKVGDSKDWILTINTSDGFERHLFQETARTDRFVELKGLGPNLIRLYDDNFVESVNGVDQGPRQIGKWD